LNILANISTTLDINFALDQNLENTEKKKVVLLKIECKNKIQGALHFYLDKKEYN